MMTINPLYIIASVVSVGLGLIVYRRGRSEWDLFKAHVWSFHGIGIALAWSLLMTGLLGAVMFVNVQVLGNDMVVETPSQGAIRQRLGK